MHLLYHTLSCSGNGKYERYNVIAKGHTEIANAVSIFDEYNVKDRRTYMLLDFMR